jgi:hypothetical protein
MSVLRGHIRAARAYEAAYSALSEGLLAGSTASVAAVRAQAADMALHAIAHGRAAEIMEGELQAEYGAPGPYPTKTEGA